MADSKDTKKQRSPIVVIMGHVDHGKTTLLDYIRKANVAARAASPEAGEPRSIAEREAGGITQAVGAYEIEVRPKIEPKFRESEAGRGIPRQIPRDDFADVRKITFIDTPGHEAFSAMRARGAQVADLAILVVAADEGVKPQTKEAIKTILDSKTPYIVAINKIDKTSGSIERAKSDLAAAGVYLEGQGGQVSFHGISAKTGEGVEELLDIILLAADFEDLSYDPAAPASGYILEVRHDPRRGSEVTAVIKNGTLKRGDPIYTPTAKGKVRMLENFLGKAADALEPSAPALIIGFESLPTVGETFSSQNIPQEKQAQKGFSKPPMSESFQKKDESVLNLLLKAADAGSLEALAQVIRGIDIKGKKLKILSETVGDITDGDMKDAIATSSVIIGFKNKIERAAKTHADAQEVKVITSDIVYDLQKAVEEFLTSSLGPAALGELEVLAVFNREKQEKQIVGGKIIAGVVRGKTSFEVMRKTPTGEEKLDIGGKVLSLRDKKSDIEQAESGKEIGLLVNFPGEIQVGDRLVIRK